MNTRGENAAEIRDGLIFGFAAHALWGGMPLYFKLLGNVGALEFLCHRIVWSAVLLIGVLSLSHRWSGLRKAVHEPHTRWLLVASAFLIATNWFVFLYAVTTNQVTQSSLGYFTNPLFMVLLGVVVLGEKPRLAQWIALVIAGCGLIYLMVSLGQVPWIAFALAGSFGLYGLARKMATVDGIVGLSIETIILTPISAGLLGWWMAEGTSAFLTRSVSLDALLLLSGPVTVVPLLFFVLAARRLPMTTMGFLQYVGPTMQLMLAVLVFKEPFEFEKIVAFSLIWSALLIVTADSLLAARRRAKEAQRAGQEVAKNVTEHEEHREAQETCPQR